MSIGFGIVGCGMISRFHCRALADVVGARFVGCVSQRRESADDLARQFSGRAYPGLEVMLADPEVQVVCICTPSGAHLEPALAAAAAGRHVIVEKPLEITLQRCDALIAACEKSGVRLATIFPSRFHQASQILKRAVEGGKFGRLTLGDAYVKWYRTQEYYDSGNWRGTWALDGGGALMNQAIHSVDLLSWLMGPVAEITAQVGLLGHQRIEVEDTAVATLRFASGALGVIEATTAAYPGAHKKIEIHGTLGSAAIEEEDIRIWSFKEMTEEDRQMLAMFSRKTQTGGGAADPSAIGHAAHAAQFQDFVNCLNQGTDPAIDGAEGRKSVEIILGIYQAARLGRSVTLPLSN